MNEKEKLQDEMPTVGIDIPAEELEELGSQIALENAKKEAVEKARKKLAEREAVQQFLDAQDAEKKQENRERYFENLALKIEKEVEEYSRVTKHSCKSFPVMQRIVASHLPWQYWDFNFLFLDAVMGTYASIYTARNPLGRMERTNFINFGIGPCCSGKGSSTDFIVDNFMKPLQDLTNKTLELEKEYKKSLKKANGAKELKIDEPHGNVRLLENDISHAAICARQEDNHGLHQLLITDEMKFVISGGQWRDIQQVLLKAYHNEWYSKRTQGSHGVDAHFYAFLNAFLMGTPKQFISAFPEMDDGLVTRLACVELLNMNEAPAPRYETPTKEEKDFIDRILQKCMDDTYTTEEVDENDASKVVNCEPKVRDLIDKTNEMIFFYPYWDKLKEQEDLRGIKEGDKARGILTRRKLDYFFRACMVDMASLGWVASNKQKAQIANFRLEQASKLIDFLDACYGTQYNTTCEISLTEHGCNAYDGRVKQANATKPTTLIPLFDALPDTFGVEILSRLCKEMNVTTRISQLVYMWKSKNLIKKVKDAKNTWQKVKIK